MKNGKGCVRNATHPAAFALGCFVFLQLVGVRSARAESPRKVEGFEVLGTLGYGFAVGAPNSWNKADPFGVMVGLDLGYTLPFGLRIGTDLTYGFGRTSESTNWMGEVITTHASSLTWGGSLGYDLLLSAFRLRGAVDSGATLYYGEGGANWAGSYYIGPRIALIWQYRAFELGLQSKYWVMPAGFGAAQVGLLSGARF
jgi:hypothetical protein